MTWDIIHERIQDVSTAIVLGFVVLWALKRRHRLPRVLGIATLLTAMAIGLVAFVNQRAAREHRLGQVSGDQHLEADHDPGKCEDVDVPTSYGRVTVRICFTDPRPFVERGI